MWAERPLFSDQAGKKIRSLTTLLERLQVKGTHFFLKARKENKREKQDKQNFSTTTVVKEKDFKIK